MWDCAGKAGTVPLHPQVLWCFLTLSLLHREQGQTRWQVTTRASCFIDRKVLCSVACTCCSKWYQQWHYSELCLPGSSQGAACACLQTGAQPTCGMCKHMQACLYTCSTGCKVGRLPKFVLRTCTMAACSSCHRSFTWLASNQGTKPVCLVVGKNTKRKGLQIVP